MTLDEQIKWVDQQSNFSAMLEDGDFEKWVAVLISLHELKRQNELSNNNGRTETT